MSDFDLEALDRALDLSLEAAFDRSIWKNVITGIADATGSFGANILSTSPQHNRNLIICTESMESSFEGYFNDGWYLNDWRFHGVPLLKRDGIVRDHQYTSRDVFEKHAYFRFLAKYGIRDACLIEWGAQPDDILILSLHHKLGTDIWSDEEAAIFSRIRERLTVSAKIMQRLSESRIAGMSDVFEKTGLAAIFFDRLGKVTHVTGGAKRILGEELTISNRRLRSCRSEETSRIGRRIQAVIDGKGLAADPKAPGLVQIERQGRKPLYMRIERLGGNLPSLFTQSIGLCLLEDPEVKILARPEKFQKLFDLSPKQAIILSKLCEGASLREIANTTGQSYETVRSHLKAIFAKTRTGRQSELVALANGIRQ